MNGVVFPGEARGAIPNGTRVVKVRSAPGDAHPDGARARVLGSIRLAVVPSVAGCEFGYTVEWDDLPGVSVAVAGHRLDRERACAVCGATNTRLVGPAGECAPGEGCDRTEDTPA